MNLRENKLKKMLKAGRVVIGSAIWETRGPGVIYTLASAGVDFVLVCTEHTAFNLETVADMVAHAHAAGITPIVRPPDLQYEAITRLLDIGCQSLFIPHLKTSAEVHRLIELARYYPQGMRGTAIYGGASVNYQDVDQETAIAHANANTLIGLNIETKECVANLDQMIPGIDWALIGYQDLSQSYGIPGQWQNKLILDAGAKVRALCKQRGIAYAAVPPSVEDFEPMIKDGAQMLLYGSDVSFLYGGAKRGVEALKALIEK